MNIRILKRWRWKSGYLTPGQLMRMPPAKCQALIDQGVAVVVDVPERAIHEAAETRTPRKRKRGRPRGSNKQQPGTDS